MASVTFIQPGSNRGVTGQTVEAFWNSISHVPLLSVGMNCALGPKEMRPLIDELAQIAPIYVSCHPNAGSSRSASADGISGNAGVLGAAVARVGRQRLAQYRRRLLRHDAGAYRGTGRRCQRQAAAACSRKSSRTLRLSGLESVTVRPESNFVNIGERTNVTGSPVFAKLVLADDYEKAVSVARQQVEGGAQIIDVNMDEGMLDSKAAMDKFLRLIAGESEIARVPVMVDSSKWEVIEAGLKCLQGKGIVNSISLKEGEEKFIAQAKTGAPLRRGGDRHGLRRERPGRYLREKNRGVRARLQNSHRTSRLPAAGHHFRPQHSHRRHRASKSTTVTPSISSRRRAGSNRICRWRKSAAA